MRAWLVTSVVLVVVAGAAAMLRRLQAPPAVRQTSDVTEYGRRLGAVPQQTQAATFAGGCFWKLEHAMRRVDGVISTTSGYTGGWSDTPDHAAVSTGRTGHVEAVRVVFDPRRVTFDQLLDVFWSAHDPTQFSTDDEQPNGGERWRPPGASIIFYHHGAQRAAAEASVVRLAASGSYERAIPTEILPAAPFHRAEDEQQQYLEKQGRGACRLD